MSMQLGKQALADTKQTIKQTDAKIDTHRELEMREGLERRKTSLRQDDEYIHKNGIHKIFFRLSIIDHIFLCFTKKSLSND